MLRYAVVPFPIYSPEWSLWLVLFWNGLEFRGVGIDGVQITVKLYNPNVSSVWESWALRRRPCTDTVQTSDGTNVGRGLRLMLTRLLMPLMAQNLWWDCRLETADQIWKKKKN